MTETERPVRLCAVCGVEDTAPMHGFAVLDDGSGTQGGSFYRHQTCCAPLGCPLCAQTVPTTGDNDG